MRANWFAFPQLSCNGHRWLGLGVGQIQAPVPHPLHMRKCCAAHLWDIAHFLRYTPLFSNPTPLGPRLCILSNMTASSENTG